MTRRGVGLVVAAAALWISARAFGIDELHTAATATALLVLVGVLWVVVPQRLAATLEVRPGFVAAGEESLLHLRLRNPGVLPTPAYEIHVRTSGGLEVRTADPAAVAPRSSRDVDLRVRALRRGVHTLGPVEALRRDPFGIATRRTVLHASAELTVTPTISRLDPPLTLGGGPGDTTRAARRVPGMGTDFVEIRPYLPGDDLRSVHWPSTAHRGELMIRRVEEARAPRAAVFVDTRATGFPAGDATRFEQAVDVAASIAVHLLERGVELTVIDGQGAVASVTDPRRRLLRRFAQLSPTSEPLHRITDRVEARAAGVGTLVAVLPAPAPAELTAWQAATRSVPQRIAVVLTDDLPADAGPGSPSRVGDAPPRGSRTSRHAADGVMSLRQAGWLTVALHPGDTAPVAWRALLAGSARAVR